MAVFKGLFTLVGQLSVKANVGLTHLGVELGKTYN